MIREATEGDKVKTTLKKASRLQRCCEVFKSRGSDCNVVDIICPPVVGIGLTELLNSGGAKAPPAPPLTTALLYKRNFLNCPLYLIAIT